MTLAEIEILLESLQDEINAIKTSVNNLNNKIDILQTSMSTLQNTVKKIDNLNSLIDTTITNPTIGDVLQYDSSGKWKNIQPSELGITGGGGTSAITSLSQLSDVYISSAENNQVLTYSSLSGKWISKDPQTTDVDMSEYLKIADAKQLYFPIKGGTIDGNVEINGTLLVKSMILGENNLLVYGGVTMYGEV